MKDRRTLARLGAAALLSACSSRGASGTSSASAAPSAAGSAAPSSTSAASARTAKFKHLQDECIFELETPEELKQSEKDGMSTSFKGASVWFTGYAGTSNYGLDQLAGLATMGSKEPPAYKGTANGVNLVITANPKASPESFFLGQGEEEKLDGGRRVGCSFSCGGTKEREAEVLALCKSVRISVDATKLE